MYIMLKLWAHAGAVCSVRERLYIVSDYQSIPNENDKVGILYNHFYRMRWCPWISNSVLMGGKMRALYSYMYIPAQLSQLISDFGRPIFTCSAPTYTQRGIKTETHSLSNDAQVSELLFITPRQFVISHKSCIT